MDDGRSRIWGSSKCCQESNAFFLEANEEIVKLETYISILLDKHNVENIFVLGHAPLVESFKSK